MEELLANLKGKIVRLWHIWSMDSCVGTTFSQFDKAKILFLLDLRIIRPVLCQLS